MGNFSDAFATYGIDSLMPGVLPPHESVRATLGDNVFEVLASEYESREEERRAIADRVEKQISHPFWDAAYSLQSCTPPRDGLSAEDFMNMFMNPRLTAPQKHSLLNTILLEQVLPFFERIDPSGTSENAEELAQMWHKGYLFFQNLIDDPKIQAEALAYMFEFPENFKSILDLYDQSQKSAK